MVLKCALDMHIRYTQLRENDIVPIQCNGNKARASRKDIIANLCVKRRHVFKTYTYSYNFQVIFFIVLDINT